jgi:RNA polymerase sigma factor (sigma-70 family)
VSDEQLAAVIAVRDRSRTAWDEAQQSFAQLHETHSRKLLAFLATRVSRSDLDDVHQEVWQRVWQSLPTGFQGGNFRAWLHQIARNHLIDRSRRKRPDQWNEEVQHSDPRSTTPDEVLLENERMTILKSCLSRLGDKLEALVRARLGGEDYDDICQRLNIPSSQVYKLYHQAKSQLTACVERALP